MARNMNWSPPMAVSLKLTRTHWIIATALVAALALGTLALHSSGNDKSAAASAASQPLINKTVVAGPGLIEPDSEDVKVGSEIAGKLKQVLAEEGDQVKKGQVLAVLVNDDYLAQVEASRAQVHQAQAAYDKVLNGSRPQERKQSFASMQQAETVEANARSDFERRQKLFDAGVISKEDFDHAGRDFKVAEDQFEASKQQFHLIDDRQRDEDIASAKAQLEFARAQLDGNEAIYQKTFLRAPFDGTILRKHHRTGESITNSSVTPDPVFTMGDVAGLRVRVDVDETDVSRVANGQRVYCVAAAYPDQKFWGRIIRVARQLGHKNVLTDEPKEKVDTKIIETLVQLDPGVHLPVGLRVDAYIQTTPQ
jgi:ABC exporter DevB family membrane fusion protein